MKNIPESVLKTALTHLIAPVLENISPSASRENLTVTIYTTEHRAYLHYAPEKKIWIVLELEETGPAPESVEIRFLDTKFRSEKIKKALGKTDEERARINIENRRRANAKQNERRRLLSPPKPKRTDEERAQAYQESRRRASAKQNAKMRALSPPKPKRTNEERAAAYIESCERASAKRAEIFRLGKEAFKKINGIPEVMIEDLI
jgi:hypothetical protein